MAEAVAIRKRLMPPTPTLGLAQRSYWTTANRLGLQPRNAAYPSGLCAERVAIFHSGAIYPKQKF